MWPEAVIGAIKPPRLSGLKLYTPPDLAHLRQDYPSGRGLMCPGNINSLSYRSDNFSELNYLLDTVVKLQEALRQS